MNISNYAIVSKETNLVINNIMWDGETLLDSSLTENCILIPWNEDTKGYPAVSPGDTYIKDENGFMPPEPEHEFYTYEWDSADWCWKVTAESKIKTINLENQAIIDAING